MQNPDRFKGEGHSGAKGAKVRALRSTGEGHSDSKVKGAQVLRFKGEGHSTCSGFVHMPFGRNKVQMKGGHEYIRINNICTSQGAHKGVVAL